MPRALRSDNRKVDVRLPEKRNSDFHGVRPVHLIITMMKWIWTSRLSTKKSLSLCTGHVLEKARVQEIVQEMVQYTVQYMVQYMVRIWFSTWFIYILQCMVRRWFSRWFRRYQRSRGLPSRMIQGQHLALAVLYVPHSPAVEGSASTGSVSLMWRNVGAIGTFR